MNPIRRQYLRLGMGLGVLAAYPSLSAAAVDSAVQDAASRINWRERSLTGFGATLWLRCQR
jgi:hypothetical protein